MDFSVCIHSHSTHTHTPALNALSHRSSNAYAQNITYMDYVCMCKPIYSQKSECEIKFKLKVRDGCFCCLSHDFCYAQADFARSPRQNLLNLEWIKMWMADIKMILKHLVIIVGQSQSQCVTTSNQVNFSLWWKYTAK